MGIKMVIYHWPFLVDPWESVLQEPTLHLTGSVCSIIFQSFLLVISTKQVEMQNECLRAEACAGAEAVDTDFCWANVFQLGQLTSHFAALLFASRSPKNPICHNTCCSTATPLRWWIRADESILYLRKLMCCLCTAPQQLWRSIR